MYMTMRFFVGYVRRGMAFSGGSSGLRGRPVAALFGLPGPSRDERRAEEGTEAQRATEAVRAAANRLSEAQRVANFGSWEWRVREDKVHWSEQLFRIFGLDPATFEATLDAYLAQVHPDDRELVRRGIAAGVRERRPFSFEHRIVDAEGEERRLRCQGEPILDAAGEVVRVIGVCQDLTEVIRSERGREEADARFRSAFENAPIGIALVEFDEQDDGRLVEVNRALAELTDQTETALVGSKLSALSLGEDADLDQPLRERLVAGEIDRFSIEKRALFGDRLAWLQLSVSALPAVGAEPPGRRGIVQVQDVTERKRFEEQLRHMADHDSLTGLMNRRRFREELETRLALQQRYGGDGALLLIDVDDLKRINDSGGHVAGDLVLRRVAEVMRARMRSTDVLGRLAGDEFAVVLPSASADQAAAIGEELIERLAAERVEGRSISVSIGVAPFRERPATAEEVTAAADAAMYRAKQRGGGVAELVAEPPPGAASGSDAPAQARGAERRPPAPGAASPSLADRVRTALDAGELLLYAQPVFHLRSGEVAHREVLVQMRGGSGEVRPAAEFLAAAAQVPGLCADIDRWVVEQALVTAADGAGRTRLHVNLAGETVNDAGHLERFISILAGLRGHAAGIGLEIGEATVDRNPVAASAGVRQLAGTGCAVILDGFTGGFGSFEYLQRLPLDQVKIDGAVTRPLLHGGADHATLRAIVKLARGTGKTTVAKQIESEALVPILRTHGVDLAQGFELGAPRPLAGG